MRALVSRYLTTLRGIGNAWNAQRADILNNAEELGRVCASLAGGKPIGVRHIKSGYPIIQELWRTGQIRFCPFRHR